MTPVTESDRFDVSGKVVIITGATKGLGRAFAFGLAQAGAKVAVSSRKADLCAATAAEISDKTGAETLGLACHVGQWDAIPQFVDAVQERFGRIDGLINNAGISPAFVDLVDMTSEYWDKVFSTNLKGPLRLAALVAPVMRDGGGGSIVNISSVGGYRGAPRNSHYSASKAARRQAELSATPPVLSKAAPCLGEDSRRVLADLLGLGPAEIDELISLGVVEEFEPEQP